MAGTARLERQRSKQEPKKGKLLPLPSFLQRLLLASSVPLGSFAQGGKRRTSLSDNHLVWRNARPVCSQAGAGLANPYFQLSLLLGHLQSVLEGCR